MAQTKSRTGATLASSLWPTLLPGVGAREVVLRKDEPRNKSSSPGG